MSFPLRRTSRSAWSPRRRGLCALCVSVLVRTCSEQAAFAGVLGLPSTPLRAPGTAPPLFIGHGFVAGAPGRSNVLLRAGASGEEPSTAAPDAAETPSRSLLVQGWGAFGVCLYLGYGVAKVVPIVIDGLGAVEAPWQWALLVVTVLFFAYVEGYRGFQKGFSPRVVSRAWVVAEEGANAPFWHKILAPAFCIGYFHGTLRRVLTSWGVTSVIFAVVIGVKQLANPYRAIIDCGVIVGLVWGIVSIIALFVGSLKDGKPPDFDPALPEDTPYSAYSP